jgi:hypothetical protein
VVDPGIELLCLAPATAQQLVLYPPLTAVPADQPECVGAQNSKSFSVAVTGGSGTRSCTWTFTNGADPPVTYTDCNAFNPIAIGLPLTVPTSGTVTYAVTVEVVDPGIELLCLTPATAQQLVLYPPLTAGPNLIEQCANSFGFQANPSGGTSSYTYSWIFANGVSSPFSSTSADGTVSDVTSGSYDGTLVVTDSDTGCPAPEITVSVTVYDPITVTALLDGGCDDDFTYAATTVTGGSSGYSYAWTFSKDGGVFLSSTVASDSVTGISVETNRSGRDVTGVVVVKDSRFDDLNDPDCFGTASHTTPVYSPLELDLVGNNDSCAASSPDTNLGALEIDSTVTGGTGTYTLSVATASPASTVACVGTLCHVTFPAQDCFVETLKFRATDVNNDCTAVDKDVTVSLSTSVAAIPVVE